MTETHRVLDDREWWEPSQTGKAHILFNDLTPSICCLGLWAWYCHSSNCPIKVRNSDF